eukprot:TRINITY_DN1829_c0_g1_i5.p3 TRINITY_DN1829_c0_g1~~TRINITY_DN1829_c0_g1_i5.p3  ORF type:complete len:192 (+),score=48.22 TRINITY_DN1829_c0_g1_i5:745-1320(+)
MQRQGAIRQWVARHTCTQALASLRAASDGLFTLVDFCDGKVIAKQERDPYCITDVRRRGFWTVPGTGEGSERSLYTFRRRRGFLVLQHQQRQVAVWGLDGSRCCSFAASDGDEHLSRIIISADERIAFACVTHERSDRGRVKVFDLATGELLHDLTASDRSLDDVRCLAYDADAWELFVVSGDGSLSLWSG